jgi:peroxiredoxin
MLNRRIRTILITVVVALAAIGGLMLLMGRLSASETAATQSLSSVLPTAGTPTVQPTDEIVATINNQQITESAWQQATRLDAVMSHLAGQSIPTAEETLDRLINEIIILNAVTPLTANRPAADAAIETKLQALEADWNVPDERVVAALTEVGLTRNDLTTRMGRLIQVEAALNQLTAKESDLNGWLAQARAEAEIGLYRPLADAAVLSRGNTEMEVAEAQEDIASPPPPITPVPLSNFAPPPNMPTAPYPQNAAPGFTLNQLTGQSFTLNQLRGKPAIINFWATWCPPCRRELPALQAAYEARRNDIGFVAVDVKEDSAAVEAFIKEMGLTFPVVVDPDGQVSDIAYEVRGIPTTLFIDANGVVAARHVGPLDEAAIEGYLAPLLERGGEAVEEQGSRGAGEQKNENSPPLNPAPDFTLTAVNGSPVSLQDYRGKSNVVLVFYRGYT